MTTAIDEERQEEDMENRDYYRGYKVRLCWITAEQRRDAMEILGHGTNSQGVVERRCQGGDCPQEVTKRLSDASDIIACARYDMIGKGSVCCGLFQKVGIGPLNSICV